MGNFNPPVVEFLTKEQRQEWYDKQVPFIITDVTRSGEGKYGSNATFTLQRIDQKTGEIGTAEYMISLTDNPRRDRITQYITETIAEHGSCGPIVLDTAPSGNGNDAWVFRPAPEKAS
jgi:hypothetical protein